MGVQSSGSRKTFSVSLHTEVGYDWGLSYTCAVVCRHKARIRVHRCRTVMTAMFENSAGDKTSRTPDLRNLYEGMPKHNTLEPKP